jgi:hypothetical protein
MFTPASILAVLLPVLTPFLPSPHDKAGWGLRVHRLTEPGPYLVGESLGRNYYFDIMLLNFSKETREYTPLIAAIRPRELDLEIIQPDKTPLDRYRGRGRRPEPFAGQAKLAPGEFASVELQYPHFGYWYVVQPGRHQMVAALKIGGKRVMSPPVGFEVVEIPADAVLVNRDVPLEGVAATRPFAEKDRAVVQQVRLGTRTILIYRRFVGPKYGGGVAYTFRLAELPGKCEMTVEGAYGNWGPLTITYKTAPDAKPTRLVINSIDGRPWTEEDERLLQERLSRVAPMPRPVAKP